jgi:hypothetical protein
MICECCETGENANLEIRVCYECDANVCFAKRDAPVTNACCQVFVDRFVCKRCEGVTGICCIMCDLFLSTERGKMSAVIRDNVETSSCAPISIYEINMCASCLCTYCWHCGDCSDDELVLRKHPNGLYCQECINALQCTPKQLYAERVDDV